jgi:hypothetical protein
MNMTEIQEPKQNDISDEDKDLLRFEVTVFYNFVFDLGESVNPTDAARKLLGTDFALASANNLNEDIELAERFKHISYLRSQAKNIIIINDLIKVKDYLKLTEWILKHTKAFSDIIFSIASNRLFSENDAKRKDDSDEKSNESLEDTLNFLDSEMIRIQILEALQRDVDRSLFAPQYLRDIPFTRVGLQPFFASVVGEDIGIDASILIHRSGIAILTFYFLFAKQKSVEELAKFGSYSSSIDSIRICKSILDANPGSLVEPYEISKSSGVEWIIYKKLDDCKLVDIFKLYQGAVISAIPKKTPSKAIDPFSWQRSSTTLAYPIVFLDRIVPPIISDSEFKERYSKELAALASRTNVSRSLKEEIIQKLINEDLSLDKDHSLYISSGHSICIYYEQVRQALIEKFGEKIPGQQAIVRHLNSSVILDIMLIQQWILVILNDQLNNIPSNFKKLNELKREILLGLEEFHNVTMIHGETQDIIRQVRERSSINESYNNLLKK